MVYPLHHPGSLTFCGFSMGSNQYWARRVYDLCVYVMTGTPEGSTESGFIEKPGIEPATLGLQDIGLTLHHGGFTPWLIKQSYGKCSSRAFILSLYYAYRKSFYNGVQYIGPFTDAHLIQCYIP